MARFGRTFPIHPNVGQRQGLAVTAPTATRLIAPVVIGVAAMAASPHVAMARHTPHIVQNRPAAYAAASQAAVFVAPPKPLVITAHPAPRSARAGHVIVGRVVAPAFAPLRTVTVVDSVAPPKQRRHGGVVAPRWPALAAATQAAAFVAPPRTVTIVESSTPRQHRQSVVAAPRWPALAAASQVVVTVTPPRTVTLITSKPPPQRRRGGQIILPHVLPAAVAFTAPPKPIILDQAPFGKRRPRSGRILLPRPVVVTGNPPRTVTILDQAPFKRRRASGRVILPDPRRAAGSVTPTSPIVVTEFLGYVTDLAESGIPNQLLAQGTVNIESTAVPTILGDTGYATAVYAPNDVCVLGYSNQTSPTDIPTLEATIGRKFTGLRQNQQYTVTSVSTAITEYDAGRTLSYRSIQFNTAPGGWAAAATGAFDTQLVAFCNAVTAANRWTAQNPFWVCLHHEATTSGGVFGTTGFLVADYKAMWAHCVPVMLATGAPIAFAYVGWDRMFVGANGIGPPTAGQSFDDLDPGTQYYSRVGSDPYNQPDSPGVLRYGTNAATLLEPVRQAALARNMDWMCGEMGCQDGSTAADHTNKAMWLDSLRVYLDGLGTIGPGVCRVLLTTQETPSLYNWDSSPEALDAGKRFGFDSYYS